jgi:hypothetical protein
MWLRRLLRRALKVLLWCVAFIVVLSVSLRIYSSWQIPKAKRLLSDAQILRTGQLVDGRTINTLRAQQFVKYQPCTVQHCDYWANHSTFYASRMSEARRAMLNWILSHGGSYLGVRPWSVGVVLTIENGKIAEVTSGLEVADSNVNDGPSGELRNVSRMPLFTETSPDFRISEYPRYRDLRPHIQYTSLAPDSKLDEAFKGDFSCIWGMRVCRSGYDVFPTWQKLRSEITQADKQRLSGTNPCRLENMDARVRDSSQIALATVLNSDSKQVFVRIDRVLRDQSQFAGQISDTFYRNDFDLRVFRDGVAVGSKLIVTSGYECNPLPASQEKLEALESALRDYPPISRDPRELYLPGFGPQTYTVPPAPIPPELLSE